MRPHPLREKARQLRKQGWSYRDIERETGISRSTLSYMLKDIVLTSEQKQRLKKSAQKNREKFSSWFETLSESERKSLARKGGENAWHKHRQKCLQNLHSGREIGSLTYRQDEIPTKKKLEKLYGTTFEKTKVGNRYIDFGNEELLIEHTTDKTKGLSDLIARFEDVQADTRTKIAYIPTRKGKRKQRLLDLGVEVHHVSELV